MKILELNLIAFGPFTGDRLDLGAGNHGLHVIYGPNEAGKSSALRAIHALLYGIPGRTDDAFLHPYTALRVGGTLRLSSGEEIRFIRRKGNKGTLLTPDDARLEDAALDRFLRGVGYDEFRMFWGIDHARLVQGGEDILAGRGNLAESLFAAGSGITRLRALRAGLEDEAGKLYLKRGQIPLINQSLNALHEMRKSQRETMVFAEAWIRIERDIKDAEERIDSLSGRLDDLSRATSRLERVKRALPLLAERRAILCRLEALGDGVILDPGFSERRQKAETACSLARQNLDRAAAELREQEEKLAALGPEHPLEQESEAVTDLGQRLGSHRKAQHDRPGLVAQRDERRSLAQRLLRDFRPDLDPGNVESLRLFMGRRTRIRKLAAERGRLDGILESALGRFRNAAEQSRELEREAAALPVPRSAEGIAIAITEARRRGDIEAEREKIVRMAAKLAEQCDARAKKLRLAPEVFSSPGEHSVPPSSMIARFVREATDLEKDTRAMEAERQRLGKRLRDLDRKIDILVTKNAIPTEESLAEARMRRNRAFGLLRERWEEGRDITAEIRELLGEGDPIFLYSETVHAADDISDRLRAEADRVAELSRLMEDRRHLGEELRELAAAGDLREAARAKLDSRWRELWTPAFSPPPDFDEAEAWREEFDRFLEQTESVRDARGEVDAIDGWIGKQGGALREAMIALEPDAPAPEGFGALLTAAERLRERVERDARMMDDHARKALGAAREMRDAEAAVATAREGIESWGVEWRNAVEGLVVNVDTPTEDVLTALESVDTIIRAMDEAADFESRTAGIDRDAESFFFDVRALARRLGEDATVGAGREETWVESLHGRLSQALREGDLRRQTRGRIDRLRAEIAQFRQEDLSARTILAALLREAQCETAGELPDAERKSAEMCRCRERLSQIERDLIRGGDGASLAEIERDSADEDGDSLAIRLSRIAEELRETEDDLSLARDDRSNARAELNTLKGSSEASERAEDIQAILARLREEVVQYSRLRVASTLLERRIEEYRREHQDPLLRRAGEMFRSLTLGAFERLDADIEEDRPVLVGIRPGGASVPAGGMSEGSRNQLFFALRLAAVEASCAVNEPLPFIVDDVLVQFDDHRSDAALRVLSTLAASTQVVLFTHHGRVRESAQNLASGGEVFVHEL